MAAGGNGGSSGSDGASLWRNPGETGTAAVREGETEVRRDQMEPGLWRNPEETGTAAVREGETEVRQGLRQRETGPQAQPLQEEQERKQQETVEQPGV